MRRRLTLLVLATTSAVVFAFVIPLCLLVRNMAVERGLANANQEARNVAILVSGLHDDSRLADLVAAVDARFEARTTVVGADGTLLGADDAGLVDDPAVARARQGSAFTEVRGDDRRILVPVVTEGGTDVVVTTVSGAELHRGVVRAWVGIVVLGLLLLALATVVADLFGRRLSRPVTELAAVAHRLREGELDARATPTGSPETEELGQALNGLADRIIELLAAERAAVGDLSHRLRTPVTALRLDVEAVDDTEVSARLGEHVEHLQRSIDAIVRAARRPVRNSLHLSCDAATLVRDRAAFWAPLAEDQSREFECRLPDEPVIVAVDAAELADIVDILVDNVFAHTPERTGFALSLTPGPQPVLTISDEGPGMDRRAEEPATVPGEGLDGQRRGTTGLGLQIVRRSVAGFHGELRTTTAPGQGTRIEIWLPPGLATGDGAPASRRGGIRRR
ncbi:MAG: HAMP domain-containing histidine kinase, partial [Nocardioidaceae bacterium]|nr:HAMP domain-containing histidine kinase [Nocardioidaceae bacterium]